MPNFISEDAIEQAILKRLQLGARIDRLVYVIYGLTDEEIALVEGKNT